MFTTAIKAVDETKPSAPRDGLPRSIVKHRPLSVCVPPSKWSFLSIRRGFLTETRRLCSGSSGSIVWAREGELFVIGFCTVCSEFTLPLVVCTVHNFINSRHPTWDDREWKLDFESKNILVMLATAGVWKAFFFYSYDITFGQRTDEEKNRNFALDRALCVALF